jgi:hypothetical protein
MQKKKSNSNTEGKGRIIVMHVQYVPLDVLTSHDIQSILSGSSTMQAGRP